jgi:hypothetical protein
VENGRGKKTNKADWHLTLGLKGVILAAMGTVALMMMSFALGALAGRGDIYRVAYSWGLLAPEAFRVAQWTPANEVTGGTPNPTNIPVPPTEVATGAPANLIPGGPAPAAVAVSPVSPHPAAAVPAPVTVASKPEHPAPVTASIAPLPPPNAAAAAAKKKGKTGTTHRDAKSREEELRRERQEVVQKLNFQNSFDTGPKVRLPKAKDHDKALAKAGGAKSQQTLVRVAQYRTSKEADAKVAELHKRGVNATLRKSKDSKGTLYVVCKPGSLPSSDGLAKKTATSGGAKKPKTE